MFNTFFVQPIYNVIILLLGLIGDVGLVIIVFSVLIRLVFWPLTAKTIHSQKKMQDLQPEIAKAKEKAGGNKQKESQFLLELYREKGVSPFSSCFPILLQFPFLIAIFIVFKDLKIDANLIYEPLKNLGIIKEFLNGTTFHPTLLGILDLSRIPLKGGIYIPGIALAVFMGLTQYIQTKMLQPKKADPTQAFVGQMNVIFPVLLTYFSLASFPLILTLYWTVYNLMNILQQRLILKEDVAILSLLWKRKQPKEPKAS